MESKHGQEIKRLQKFKREHKEKVNSSIKDLQVEIEQLNFLKF